MYVWNGFTIVGKRADYTEALLVTIETAEEQLRNHPCEQITTLLLFTALSERLNGIPQGSFLGLLGYAS